MTDNNVWHPPTGSPIPPMTEFGAPAPGSFAPPVPGSSVPPPPGSFAPPVPGSSVPPPSAGAAVGAVLGQPGWTPPPKPGLIPLRPLAFGTLLGASFQVLRRNPRATFGTSLLLTGVITLMIGALYGYLAFMIIGRLENAALGEQDDILAGGVGWVFLASAIPLILSVVTTAMLQGIVSLEVARGTIGERLKLSGLWRLAKGRMGALIGWSFLASGVVFAAVLIVMVIIIVMGSLGGAVGVGLAVVFVVIASIGGGVASAWISIKLALVPSILMLERESLWKAVARSWSLTGGFFWKTFGTLALVYVIVQVAAQVVTTPITFVLSIAASLINPNGDMDGALALAVAATIVGSAVTAVFASAAAVVQSAVVALVYIDIRMRKEGLDLDLTRFVEARQTDDSSVGNPYSRRQSETAAGSIDALGPAGYGGGTSGGTTPNESPWI